MNVRCITSKNSDSVFWTNFLCDVNLHIGTVILPVLQLGFEGRWMPGFAWSYKNEGTLCHDVPIMKTCYKK